MLRRRLILGLLRLDSFRPATGATAFKFRLCVAACSLMVTVLGTAQAGPGDVVVTKPGPAVTGEPIQFKVALDKPPMFEGATLTLKIRPPFGFWKVFWLQIKHERIDYYYRYPLIRGIASYTFEVVLPASAAAGRWKLKTITFSDGARSRDLSFHSLKFEVAKNRELSYPTRASAVITPSQSELLNQEALALQTRIQTMKSDLARGEHDTTFVYTTLSRNIYQAIQSVKQTKAKFQDGAVPEQKKDAEVFFGDLLNGYNEALGLLHPVNAALQTRALRTDMPLMTTSGQISNQPANSAVISGVLRAFEQNELAYTVVLSRGSLVFNLTVTTVPPGASVAYKRHGDLYQACPNQTNTFIPNLPYAIWIIRVQLPGYPDQEREHDPFREPNHVISIEMKK